MNSSRIDKYAFGINFMQDRHIVFDVPSSTIMVRDNYDCDLRRPPAEAKPILQYALFVALSIFLFGRRYAVRMVRRCRVGLGATETLHEEQQSEKDKVEFGKELDRSVLG